MKPFIILKSLVSGYTRRNGTYVAPHSDKRTKRAAPDDGQLVLFPAPEPKPVPPNPFKGLDPVASTGDLFAEPLTPAPAPSPVSVYPGKGMIKDKWLSSHEGDGTPGGPWDTPEQAEAAAHEWGKRKAQRADELARKRAHKDAIAARLLAGGEPTDRDIEALGLRAGSSELKYFIPAAAELFGITSRAVRPHIADLVGKGQGMYGGETEHVSPKKALQAIASKLAAKPADSDDNHAMKTEPKQKRAKAGGEHGANGEWYEGGKFIATTDHAKRKGSTKGTGRQEIEPYVWDHPPEPGMRSLYRRMSPGVFTGIVDGKWGLNPHTSDHTWGYYNDFDPEAVARAKAMYQALADRYNAGERWTKE